MRLLLLGLLPVLLLAGCAAFPIAPACDESGYRSLNPAHYDPAQEDTTRA